VLARIREELRAFVGMTAFEEICRQWIAERGRAGQLPFEVREVGSHWSRDVQVDVVAINWTEHAILLGECKWGTDRVGRRVIGELVESKTPRVLQALPEQGQGWNVYYAFFARTGFTDAAIAEAGQHHALLVNLDILESLKHGSR
jgi:hypothetical protein